MSRQHPKCFIFEYNWYKLAMALDACILNNQLIVKSMQLY